eukprot:2868322-Lingulodinium_polyedra.AAC.1
MRGSLKRVPGGRPGPETGARMVSIVWCGTNAGDLSAGLSDNARTRLLVASRLLPRALSPCRLMLSSMFRIRS